MTIDVKGIHREFLRDPEFAAEYLNGALEEGNEAVIRMALRNIADAQKDQARPDLPHARSETEGASTVPSETIYMDLARLTKDIQSLGLNLRAQA